jgi:CspA family cold shock protein
LEKFPFGAYEAERRKAFTEDLIALSSSVNNFKVATVHRERGVVKWFSVVRGYGFIQSDIINEQDIFVHYSDIRSEGFRNLFEGDTVDFIVVQSEKGPIAKDVTTIDE